MFAFLILAHDDPVSVMRLIERLHPHHVYLHVDAKTQMTPEWSDLGQFMIEERVPVFWAGFSQVTATLHLIRSALSSEEEYEKLILLSGSCYPCRPIAQLEKYLSGSPYENFILYTPVDDSPHLSRLMSKRRFQDGLLPWSWISRWEVVKLLDKMLRWSLGGALSILPKRRPKSFQRYHGSGLWAISSQSARYILGFLTSPEGVSLVKYYRTAFASDEQFFHSILANSHYRTTSTGLRPYSGRGTYKMANLHHIDSSLAKWFSIDDAPAIIASEKFFVRKLRSPDSDPLKDLLDGRS